MRHMKSNDYGFDRNTEAETGGITVSDFTDVEIEYICQQITPKRIKAYFQRYPQEFNKMRPGVRASSLSDDNTAMLVCKNIRRDFVASFIRKQLYTWKREIVEYQKVLEEQGESHQRALLKTIPQSVFSGNVRLFFKVIGEHYSEDYIILTEDVLRLLDEEEKISTETLEGEEVQTTASDRIALQERENELLDQVARLQLELETEKNARFETERKLISIKEQLVAVENKESRLQAELEGFHKLSRYSDEELKEAQSEDYQYTSICQIFTDYNGKKCRRLADIENGKVSRFNKNEEEPPYFANRDRLPLHDGPDTEGFIGVWDWNAVPNYKDLHRDYIHMQYNSNKKYIEVIELTECHSCEEISDHLAKNTFSCMSGNKILFVYRMSENQMGGLLCGTQELDFYEGSARLKKNVYILPQYTIDVGDVLEINGRKVFRYLNMGMPKSIFKVKSPLEVVKEIVVKRATSSKLRQSGLSIREAQHCQTFLKELPEEMIYEEIADVYGCTETDARKYLSAFIEQADAYLSEGDIDLKTLGAALERNAGLVVKCKKLLSEDWKAENSQHLRMAQDELEAVRKSTDEEKKICNTYKEQYIRLQGDLEKLQTDISRQEKLAQDVEEKIAARISSARRDAADFIAEMAFAMPNIVKKKDLLTKRDSETISVTYRKKDYIIGDEITDMDSFEEELTDNLNIAGYDVGTAFQMAQMIVFAICNKMPIVCGYNAERIADCISAMFGEEGVCMVALPMGESRCKAICDFIGQEMKSVNRVFIVNGIFDGFSLNAFHEIRQCSEAWGQNVILIFPLNGVNTEMVSSYVWNQSIFIDGDIGIVDFEADALNAFYSNIDLLLNYDTEDFRIKHRLLKQFRGIIDNTAMLNYAKYLAVTDRTIEPNEMLLVQIMMSAKASGKKEELLKVLSSIGFDIKSDKFIKKYL